VRCLGRTPIDVRGVGWKCALLWPSESYAMPKKQAEAVLGDLMTLATRHLRTRDKIFRTSLGILHVQNRHAPTG
jgi:hypothetical protein